MAQCIWIHSADECYYTCADIPNVNCSICTRVSFSYDLFIDADELSSVMSGNTGSSLFE